MYITRGVLTTNLSLEKEKQIHDERRFHEEWEEVTDRFDNDYAMEESDLDTVKTRMTKEAGDKPKRNSRKVLGYLQGV